KFTHFKIKNIIKISNLFLVGYVALSTAAYAADSFPANFNDNDELIQPEGYRQWVHVGTQVTPNDMNNGKAEVPEFHNVYIDPESFTYWKKTGKFRDGTM